MDLPSVPNLVRFPKIDSNPYINDKNALKNHFRRQNGDINDENGF